MIMFICTFFTLLIAGDFSSCGGARTVACEDRDEPTSVVHFTNKTPDYWRVLAVGSDKSWSGHFDHVESGTYTGWAKALPVSIVADTTTYIFERAGSADTLSFTYVRDIRFESPDCGFTVTLQELRLTEASTFRDVEFTVHTGTGRAPSRPEGLTTAHLPAASFHLGNNIYQITIGDE